MYKYINEIMCVWYLKILYGNTFSEYRSRYVTIQIYKIVDFCINGGTTYETGITGKMSPRGNQNNFV